MKFLLNLISKASSGVKTSMPYDYIIS